MIRNSTLDAIGNTPLIKLKHASEASGCTILGKAEFMNPGQSVKDRAGKFIIEDAIAKGDLKPGGVVVEGTAGNTGIGLSVVANALGFRTVIVIPETQSQEKKDALTLMGAELIQVPAAPYKNPNNYVRLSGRLAEQIAKSEPNGAIWANQFDNVANRDGHIKTTAREIWDQTDGKVDGFVSAVGTGGTLAGVGIGLKELNKDVKIAIADPHGAALHSYYTTGEFGSTGNSITEGIGQGRITGNLEGFTPDFSFQISDAEAIPVVFDLLEHEGLCLGGSTGVNVVGAMRLAKELGPGHTIVTMLCDHGSRYQSKLFNPEFLRSKELPVPHWLERESKIEVPFEKVDQDCLLVDTVKAFLEDTYLTACDACVLEINERGGIILDKTNFYATSGGQPGDSGYLEREDGSRIAIATTVNGASKLEIVHVPAEGEAVPQVGEQLTCHIDWDRRYNLMRMHTACHLLSVVCPYPITSANVSETDSRIDFDIPKEAMEAGISKQSMTDAMMKLVNDNHPIFTQWITEAELDANPDIVRSKNVKPPRGVGDIRLVCIGEASSIDSQPCGGTHVSETQEVGEIHIGKIENKGKENRRFRLRFGPLPSQEFFNERAKPIPNQPR